MNPSSNCPTERMREKLKFGIVGAGNAAQSYAQAFEHSREAKVVAVADTCVDAAQAMAERLRCRAYKSYQHMAQDCALDAVVVCTPPVTHPDICIYLVENGIHVLCEKPFSIDEQHAQSMLTAARRAGVKLAMATKFRYVEDVVLAKSMVASGVLGELILLENVFASRVDMTSRWNAMPEISGGGVLIDNGTHSVDLLRYFLGPLAEVHALEGKRSQGLPVEETAAVLARSEGGVICRIDLSWSLTTQKDSYLDIYGSRGAISIGWRESKHLDYSRREWTVFGHGYDKLGAFASQIDNFSRALRGEEPLSITEDDTLASVLVVEAAYRALHQNQWMSVHSPTDQLDVRETKAGHRIFV
jgi:predicted dehydrogenase